MTTLLVLLCQSAVLLLLGFLALHLTQKRGPAVQTLVGRATLSGVALLLLLLPLSGRIAPVWRLPVSPPAPILGSQKDAGTLLAASSVTPPPSVLPAPSALPPVSTKDAAGPTHQEDAASSAPAPPPAALPHPSFRKDPATEERGSKAVGLPALLLLLWLALCHCQLIRLRRTAKLIADGPAAELLAELTPNPPLLLTHPSVQSPFLAGTRRPAIFLPPAFAADFTADALRAVFLHELAHRDRRDNLWTLAARLLTALLWFQPLLWLLGRKLEQISEDACDQAVLAAHCPPRAYAACLLSLAERPPLTRSQRTLTAAVAPFRSSIGRRIKAILSGTRYPTHATPGVVLGAVFCTLFCVPGVSLLLNSGLNINVPNFTWAKQQGWEVRPIQVINIDHPGLTRIAGLPYEISIRDATDAQQMSQFDDGDPVIGKKRAEEVLTARPHFFYAEYSLGIWYQQHGNSTRASVLLAQSLRDAPVVLAGRFEYDDGTPVVGLHFGTTIQCYDPAHLSATASAFRSLPVELRFPELVTDSEGCYYIPVFRAIYSQEGVSWYSDQINTVAASRLKAHADLVTPGPATSGSTSSGGEEHLDKGFVAESHVAVLPQTEVRPVVMLNPPFNALQSTTDKPMPLSGSAVTLSWHPYPKAAQYIVRVYENRPVYDNHGLVVHGAHVMTQMHLATNSLALLGQPITQTSVNLNFAGLDPVFNRTYSYSVVVQAQDRGGETLSHSDQCCFKPLNALAPQPLTKTALAQALGPGFVVQSLQLQTNQVIAIVQTPANVQWTFGTNQRIEASGRRFGLSDYVGWSSAPGISMNEANPANTMRITYQKNN